MRVTHWVTLLSVAGPWLGFVACGTGDTGGGTGTGATTGGNSGVGGGPARGGTAGTTGSAGATSGTLVGSCLFASSGICLDYYCVDPTICDNMAQVSPQGCQDASGAWASSACSATGSVGTCRSLDATGYTIETFYSPLTTAQAQEVCVAQGDTFTAS